MEVTDKQKKLGIGVVIIGVLYFTNNISGLFGTILLIVAIILALTVLINFCPLYFLLGLRTNKKV